MKPFQSALVTGATGFIGSALVKRLLAEEVRVTCVIRARNRASNSLAALAGARVIEVPSFHVGELKTQMADVRAETVFNLASYGVQQQDRDTGLLLGGNVALLCNLLEATAEWPLRRFLHAGSCSEYGQPAHEGTAISEQQPLRPTSLYGAAKAAAFKIGNGLALRLHVPFATLRLFGVFGAHEAPQRLAPYLINRLKRDQPVDLTPGEQVRDFLYEDDATDAFLAAAAADSLPFYEAYNVCSGQATRVREFGEAVADALGKPRELLHWGERAYRTDEPTWQVGDHRRFAEAAAWAPRVTVADGIRRMISAAEKKE
jgi:nucleoside-diphosphate-sugar epimerase